MLSVENTWVYHQFWWANDNKDCQMMVLTIKGKWVYHPYLSHNREDHWAHNPDTPVMIEDQLSAQIMCMGTGTQHNLSR